MAIGSSLGGREQGQDARWTLACLALASELRHLWGRQVSASIMNKVVNENVSSEPTVANVETKKWYISMEAWYILVETNMRDIFMELIMIFHTRANANFMIMKSKGFHFHKKRFLCKLAKTTRSRYRAVFSHRWVLQWHNRLYEFSALGNFTMSGETRSRRGYQSYL